MAFLRCCGRRLCRHCQLLHLTVFSTCLVIAIYIYCGTLPPDTEFSSTAGSSKSTCVRPRLELWNDRLRQLFVSPPPLKCSTAEKSWVYVKNGTFYISSEAVAKHGAVTCEYIPIHRGRDDFEVSQGDPIKSIRNASAVTSDVFRIKCTGDDGQKYSNIYPAISFNEQVVDRSKKMSRLLPQNALKMNIIMFGFDSVSRLTWMRNLPKSYSYLINTLGAVVMEGYNIVGDGTPQALLPILTGFTETELPEARRGFAGAKNVDDHPWIWNHLKEIGYITQWGEESPDIGTFTYRMLGFRKQPVDFYLRTFYMAAESQYKLHRPYCLGTVPRHAVMMQWAHDFLDMYSDQLKFSFVFHSEYSHDANNKLQWADRDLLEFLQSIEERGHLNNSLLILMSDHGARFQNVRVTEQGKYEERMPFLAVRLPHWFSQMYPDAARNLRDNAQKLTTPFDLHETFRDVIDFKSSRRNNRGTSLFSSISDLRSCAEAGIEPHWCTCLQWQSVSEGSPLVQQAADEVISVINRLTQDSSTKCARLTRGDIISAVRYVAGKDVLRFRQSVDVHGRTADLSDDMKPTVEYYQVTFSAQPSGALYEATVKHIVNDIDNTLSKLEGQFSVDLHDISRINRYGSQPDCVATQMPHLRPYCYCTNS